MLEIIFSIIPNRSAPFIFSTGWSYKVLKYVNERHTFLALDLDYTLASSFHRRIEIR